MADDDRLARVELGSVSMKVRTSAVEVQRGGAAVCLDACKLAAKPTASDHAWRVRLRSIVVSLAPAAALMAAASSARVVLPSAPASASASSTTPRGVSMRIVRDVRRC